MIGQIDFSMPTDVSILSVARLPNPQSIWHMHDNTVIYVVANELSLNHY